MYTCMCVYLYVHININSTYAIILTQILFWKQLIDFTALRQVHLFDLVVIFYHPRTDFIITASQDGHVKFWKKKRG